MSRLLSIALVAGGMALFGTAAVAQPSSGDKPYCLQQGTSGTVDCSYDSMEQCRKAMTGPTDGCSMAGQTRGQGGGNIGAPSNMDVPPATGTPRR